MLRNDCVPPYPQSYLNYAPVVKLSQTGAWGKPSLATAEKGRQIAEAMIQGTAAYIKDAFSHCEKKAW